MKVCTKCNIEKEDTDFTKSSRNKNGLHHCCKECLKKYRENNKENIKKWRDDNKDRIVELHKKWDMNNKDKRRLYNKEYKQKNKEKNREKINKYYSDRKKNDPFFKFKLSVRNLIYNSYRRQFNIKNKRTFEILGCSFCYFKLYIESKFNENMSWDNYGFYWEFDHIIQLATAKTEKEVLKLNHYTNFQPLEVELNRSKNFKF